MSLQSHQTVTMLLTNATLPDGTLGNVRICSGVIDAVASGLTAQDGEPVHDLSGFVLLPAPVEPHAHLDKAFLAERIDNPTGDLMGAIRAMEANRHLVTIDDTIERAERAVRLMALNGVTAIRTHADTTPENGLRSIEALVEVRRRTSHVVDLQICSLVGWPITGAAGADNRARLRDALEMGADLVGGCPHLDDDPAAANEAFLMIAAQARRGVDLHVDETLNPAILAVEDLADRVSTSGFDLPVTASHCVSLGMQPAAVQQRVAEKIAAAGISVIALPQTNLYLQGRDHAHAVPRGLTAIGALRAAGVNVAAGADNLQDPFNLVGKGDPLETAALMVMAGHLLPADAYASVSVRARTALGLADNSVVVGGVADLVAIRAGSVREAVAFQPAERLVLRSGSMMPRAG